MIKISYKDSIISVSGHAGYAESGKDIVCAGITALVQGLVESIYRLTDETPDCDISPGKFQLNTKNLSKKSLFLVSSFFVSSKLIADEFPDHVKIDQAWMS